MSNDRNVEGETLSIYVFAPGCCLVFYSLQKSFILPNVYILSTHWALTRIRTLYSVCILSTHSIPVLLMSNYYTLALHRTQYFSFTISLVSF